MMARASTAPTSAVATAHVKVLVAAVRAFSSRDGPAPSTGGLTFTWLTLVSFYCQISALTSPRQNPSKVTLTVPLAASCLYSDRNSYTLSGL
jgi:hypothetical protein